MKKETTVFVRVPIMAFGILLLICNCALAQKELVIEYTAEFERMRCTIEEYVQNGDKIKYSVQDEPADIQIMTYKQMQKAAENGDILPIEIDDVSSTVKFGNDVYGCAIKNYRTEFKVQHLELWKKMGLSVPEKELSWDILLEIADKVSDYNDEHGTNLYVLENSSRFPNSPLFLQKDGSELWSRISGYISADKEMALFKEVVLETTKSEEGEILNSVIALRFGEQVFRLSQPEMRCYVISSHTQVYEQAQRFLKTYANNAELCEIRFDEDLPHF